MNHTRREFLAYVAAGSLAASCRESTTPQPDAPPPQRAVAKPSRIIDVHTHLFNANFLPLDGVLAKWVSGTAAAIVASVIRARTDDCTGRHPAAFDSPDGDLRRLEEASDEQIIDEMYRTTPPEAFMDRDVSRSLTSVKTEMSAEERKQRAEAEFKQAFRQAADERPKETFPERGGFLQFLALMTWCEQKIWSAARAAYPDVSLFIAHMMDMENYYPPSKPVYSWPKQQVDRMVRLMKASDGSMLPFFAFDPKRDNWEDLTSTALNEGCAGVKFYPPSGYGPIGEDGKFNRNTRAFFTYCVANDIPVFAHTTAHGFESVSGNGKKFANPVLWRRVLSYVENGKRPFEKLRLCFGHAGGEPGWFPKEGEAAPQEPPFSAEVIALCREFENVYCEVAYLSPILTPEGRRSFQAALEKAIAAGGAYPFATKIMYGSDWHMIHKLKAHRQYLPAFIEALGDARWDSIRDDFFAGNAVRWLNLRRYVDRMSRDNPGVLSEAAVAHLTK